MKSLINYINENLLPEIFEGGNAVTANPIPAYIAPLVYKDVEDAVLKYNKSLKIVPLGSLGKKLDDQFNGDIDVAISITDRDKLIEMINTIWPDFEVNKFVTPSIVSMSFPYDKEGKKGNAQVDFMMTDKIDWAKWRYSSPDFKKGESKYKAAAKVLLIRSLVSSIPVKDAKDEYFEDGKTVKKHWKYTFNTEGVFLQLLDYTGKKGPLKNPKRLKEFEKLIANDPENVMKFILGDKFSDRDFVSAEALWTAFHEKWPFGDESMAKAEELFYKDNVENEKCEVKLNADDFPCKFYNK